MVLLLVLAVGAAARAQLHVDLDGLESGSNAGPTQGGFESFRAPGSDTIRTGSPLSWDDIGHFFFSQQELIR